MQRILFIIHDINYGGAAKMLSYLANSLSDVGYDVHVYTYMGESLNYKLNKSIKYHYRNPIKRDRLRRFLEPFIPVRKVIKTINPNIVISFLTNANLYTIFGTSFTNIPVILCERGDPFMENNFENKIKKFFYNFSEGFVFQTEGARDFYNKAIKSKSAIIPNPVTVKVTEIIPYEDRSNDIVFVARFDIKQKRQDLMVDAFEKITKENKNLKLVFYGEGEDKELIEKKVYDLNIGKRVVFAGKVKNIGEYIKFAKYCVLTSDFEGIPNAIIEALSLGVPVVATDCSPGGAKLLVKNGINGFLVPRGNAESISRSILYLEQNPDEAKKFAKEAVKIHSEFSPDKILNDWINYIEKVVRKS
ncbi:MAG: hypothetical protein CVV00_05150 [Firmicutes bacterium HGW-Firmicutes-5]|nr:MAG: hypothetical protein CVV00_05150 [Firmicutes bacterium HGW-Firmicutes-5]